MRSLGGYFIRRRLDGNCKGKDYVYRAVLHSVNNSTIVNGFVETSLKEAGL